MGIDGTAGVPFGTPERGRERSAQSAGGRTCETDGCATVLSIYNTASACSIHEQPQVKHALYREPGTRPSRPSR